MHRRILGHFADLGPYGLAWNPKKRQENAFLNFREELYAEVKAVQAGNGSLTNEGLLIQMAEKGTLDETLIGNLIYQAEMGRSDILNFFRWLTRHAADDPGVLDRIAKGEPAETAARSLVEGFVLETLRTDQSERLMRTATQDIVSEDFLIPQFSTIRLCLWESHHTESHFANPHQFDPTRFLEEMPSNDRYAPFGVDHHQCPFGGPVIQIGMIFMRALARGFRLTKLSEGPPVRAGYHWEPARKFSVRLDPR